MPEHNPILNNPYAEPQWHYATNTAGELDYEKPVKGRRTFTPEIQTIPVRQGSQAELMGYNTIAESEHGSHIVNLLRREVGAWLRPSIRGECHKELVLIPVTPFPP